MGSKRIGVKSTSRKTQERTKVRSRDTPRNNRIYDGTDTEHIQSENQSRRKVPKAEDDRRTLCCFNIVYKLKIVYQRN